MYAEFGHVLSINIQGNAPSFIRIYCYCRVYSQSFNLDIVTIALSPQKGALLSVGSWLGYLLPAVPVSAGRS